jgi:hypothetical protein
MSKPVHRMFWSTTTAVAVLTATMALPSYSHREGTYPVAVSTSPSSPGAPVNEALTHVPANGLVHSHNDPRTKNLISRAGDEGAATQDPTTPEQAAANRSYVERSRRATDPTLTTVPLREPRRAVPEDRYAMAEGCYRLAGRPLFFQATGLGRYLLYTADRGFVAPEGLASQPSATTDWITTMADGRFRFRLSDGRWLRKSGAGLTTGSTPTGFALHATTGCRRYPEVQVNVSGLPRAGITPYQEVRGYVDPHVHGMAFEFLGGDVHCGRPWHRYGAPYALVDCPDHTLTGGSGAVLEAILSGRPTHDPVGWPTFKDWPAPESLTHEGVYYKWLERAWRGGLRIYSNLLVENDQLCKLYPIKHNSCDDMDSLRLQAEDMRTMERHIDAQYGGPGKGWYRIVTNPFQARRVINEGKLAVIMGIETSVPFGCSMKLDVPECDAAKIDAGLDEMYGLGVRQMELVNKFDNALSGVAGDEGAVGAAVNAANLLETGSFWDMRHCDPADGESHDKDQLAAPEISAEQQDALFGAVGQLFDGTHVALPLYGRPDHCNARGLTPLGVHLINSMVERHVIFDPDHMSVKARKASLAVMEHRHYSGVISSHSWSTPDAYPRIYKLGGFVAPYAGDSTGFFDKWRRHLTWADKRFYFGFGYGADMNGLGAQGNPRGADVSNPVTYPFSGLGGVTIGKQHSGQRVYEINVDGVAHYGLYPDWIEDLRKIGGPTQGADIVEDLSRGAEALPADVGASRGHQGRSVPQPGTAQVRRRLHSRGTPGDDHPAGPGGRGPAVHPPGQPVRLLRPDEHDGAGPDPGRVRPDRSGRGCSQNGVNRTPPAPGAVTAK